MIEAVDVDLGGPISLKATLECGQAFRWRRTSLPGRPELTVAYRGVMPLPEDSRGSTKRGPAGRHLAVIAAQDNTVTCRLTIAWEPGAARGERVREAALKYFSADDDLASIERTLSCADSVMAEAVPLGHGLRVLRQDPWECLASYVLSINNSIPNISRSIEHLARCLGDNAGLGEFAFPSPPTVARQENEILRQSKCGFRDRHLKDAAERVASGEVDLAALDEMPAEQAREKLMGIKGVGPKVADCVLLFAYHRLDVFPVDVWIARAMSRFYLRDLPVTPKAARDEGTRRFDRLAGYAQEHLFYYVRSTPSA